MVEEILEDREIRVMSEKLKVGILGGTGMVGQRFISLLENHPATDNWRNSDELKWEFK